MPPRKTFRFDLKNERVAAKARIAGAKLVTVVTEEGREALRAAISRAIREKRNPQAAARLIVGTLRKPEASATAIPGLIGLNTPQTLAALNYQANLIDTGHSPAQVDRLMAKYVSQKQRERAELIATTEAAWALNAGMEEAYRDAIMYGLIPPSSELVWVVTKDERLCGRCRPMDGKTKPIGGAWPGGVVGPPLHPRCLPGDSLVAPIGRITATSERWYEGDLVIVRTSAGHELSCTPNHSVLTNSGWIQAGLLDVGDDVISLGRRDWVTMIDAQHEDMPARIEDVARAHKQFRASRAAVVEVAPQDFEGDGLGSEVAVIRSDSTLRDGGYAALSEQIAEEPLANVHAPKLLDRFGVGAALIEGAVTSSRGDVGGSNLFGALKLGHALPLNGLARTLVARFDTATEKQTTDDTPRDAVLVGEGVLGLAAQVTLDKVASVRWAPFHGHVFNLETSNELYIANGLLVHNCRCGIRLKKG